MKTEIRRELSNIYLGNQLLEEKETVVHYSDGSFDILTPETISENEEDDE
ncbi:hypothetical protein [Bacillus bingmayongensis]|nr:hypothetical protein [Bacillus bingmayongensis]MBY0597363.1 hypothetical protein [Bacillus bingmayongensis]